MKWSKLTLPTKATDSPTKLREKLSAIDIAFIVGKVVYLKVTESPAVEVYLRELKLSVRGC